VGAPSQRGDGGGLLVKRWGEAPCQRGDGGDAPCQRGDGGCSVNLSDAIAYGPLNITFSLR